MFKWGGLLLGCLGLWLCPSSTEAAGISAVHRLVKLGLADSALTIADSVLQRDSTNLALRLLVADILRLQGDDAGRVGMLRVAVRLAPQNLDARLALIEALWDSGLPDSARALVGRGGGTLGRRRLRGHYLEGRLQDLAGYPDSAVVAYRRVWDALRRERLF